MPSSLTVNDIVTVTFSVCHKCTCRVVLYGVACAVQLVTDEKGLESERPCTILLICYVHHVHISILCNIHHMIYYIYDVPAKVCPMMGLTGTRSVSRCSW